MIGWELLAACAPNVAPTTLQAIIQVESGGNPLAIHVNGGPAPRAAADAADAARLARAAIQAGYSVDLGLMQVNSSNLTPLGYTIDAIFEPCTNIRAGAAILTASYSLAAQRHGEGQGALQAALSAYNTGNFQGGFRNGYVAKYYGPKALRLATRSQSAARPMPPAGQGPSPYAADTIVLLNQEGVSHAPTPP